MEKDDNLKLLEISFSKKFKFISMEVNKIDTITNAFYTESLTKNRLSVIISTKDGFIAK